jgi:5-oxoprolinase (ATP-hydrolysing)
MISEPQDGDFEAAFSARHLQEFSFHVPGRPIVVDDIRVRGIAFDPLTTETNGISDELAQADKDPAPVDPSLACDMASVFFEDTGRLPTAAYMLESLPPSHYISVSEHSLGE